MKDPRTIIKQNIIERNIIKTLGVKFFKKSLVFMLKYRNVYKNRE